VVHQVPARRAADDEVVMSRSLKCFVASTVLGLFASIATAQAPEAASVLRLQGRLTTSGGAAINGPTTVVFKIYDAAVNPATS
jgi:hypothetical protein